MIQGEMNSSPHFASRRASGLLPSDGHRSRPPGALALDGLERDRGHAVPPT